MAIHEMLGKTLAVMPDELGKESLYPDLVARVGEKNATAILSAPIQFRIVYLRRETGRAIAEGLGFPYDVLVRLSDNKVLRFMKGKEDQDKALYKAAKAAGIEV